jgi:hypothetical protein
VVDNVIHDEPAVAVQAPSAVLLELEIASDWAAGLPDVAVAVN